MSWPPRVTRSYAAGIPGEERVSVLGTCPTGATRRRRASRSMFGQYDATSGHKAVSLSGGHATATLHE